MLRINTKWCKMTQIDNIGLKEAQNLQTGRRRGELFKGTFRNLGVKTIINLKKILHTLYEICTYVRQSSHWNHWHVKHFITCQNTLHFDSLRLKQNNVRIIRISIFNFKGACRRLLLFVFLSSVLRTVWVDTQPQFTQNYAKLCKTSLSLSLYGHAFLKSKQKCSKKST